MIKLNIQRMKPELKSVIQDFNSGNPYLDNFIKSSAVSNDSIGKTYLLLSDDEKVLIGYYNITVGSLDIIDSGIHRKIGGCVHINCFALDNRFHKQVEIIDDNEEKIYISDLLLDDCLQRVEQLRKEYVGIAFVTLNSTEEGVWLYTRNDFEPLEEDMFFSIEDSDLKCTQMYLPLELEE